MRRVSSNSCYHEPQTHVSFLRTPLPGLLLCERSPTIHSFRGLLSPLSSVRAYSSLSSCSRTTTPLRRSSACVSEAAEARGFPSLSDASEQHLIFLNEIARARVSRRLDSPRNAASGATLKAHSRRTISTNPEFLVASRVCSARARRRSVISRLYIVTRNNAGHLHVR